MPLATQLASQDWGSFYKYEREPEVSYGIQAWALTLRRVAKLGQSPAPPPCVARAMVGAFLVDSLEAAASVYYGVRPSRWVTG